MDKRGDRENVRVVQGKAFGARQILSEGVEGILKVTFKVFSTPRERSLAEAKHFAALDHNTKGKRPEKCLENDPRISRRRK